MLGWLLLITFNLVGANMCVRSIASHFLNANTPTNSSITLFTDYPARQTRIYLNSAHSNCIAPTSGTHTFFCNGVLMKLRCQQGENWELGLGIKSQLYNHYNTLQLSHNFLHMSDNTLSNAMDVSNESDIANEIFRYANSECVINSNEIRSESLANTIILDTSTSQTALPRMLYAFVLEEFEKGHAPELSCRVGETDIKCGINCLWISNIIDGTRLNVVEGNNEEIRFSQRILDNYRFGIRNTVDGIIIKVSSKGMFYNSAKMLIELFLLVKIIFLAWSATIRHEDEHENGYWSVPFAWLCVLTSGPIGPLDMLHGVRLFVTISMATIATVHMYSSELGTIRHTVPKLITMTALPELDNNECKIIGFSLILLLTILEMAWFVRNLPRPGDTLMLINVVNSWVFIGFFYTEYLKLYLDTASSLYSFQYVAAYHVLYFVCIFYGSSIAMSKTQ